ncbi:MAG: zincin-like metallopeptidase domain-containing protein [Patescibacteria group bacterium]
MEFLTVAQPPFNDTSMQVIHATAHESRLNRTSILEMSEHGADPYSIEELIAEMGASYLCYHAGILPTPIGDYFAYLNGWLWISFGKILTLLLQQAYMRSGRLTTFWGIRRQPARKKRKRKCPKPWMGNRRHLYTKPGLFRAFYNYYFFFTSLYFKQKLQV